MRRLCVLAALLVLTLGAGTACQRHVYDASLGAQLVSGGITEGDGRDWHTHAGAPITYWTDEIQAAAQGGAETITLQSGMFVNDAINGGFTQSDKDVWSWTVMSIPKSVCVELVFPAVTPAADTAFPGLTTQVMAARSWASANLRSKVDFTFDWKPYVEANPQRFPDGIHMGDQEAMIAYHDLLTGGCP
jgi:hypothetical protein